MSSSRQFHCLLSLFKHPSLLLICGQTSALDVTKGKCCPDAEADQEPMGCLLGCCSQTLHIIRQRLWKCIPIGYVKTGRFLLAAVQCHLSLQLTLAAISLLAVGCEGRGDNCASKQVIMLSAFCLKMISLPCKHAVP